MSAVLSLHMAYHQKKLKVERLGSKQLSPDDNKDGGKKAGPDKNDNTEDLLRETRQFTQREYLCKAV